MPIVWRYILTNYLKVFGLCLITLFGISFLIKHRQLSFLIIAGATPFQALTLTVCMLILTLPHMLGIVTFVSSFLTSYKLNLSGELSALRSNGLSLSKIFAPIYFIGAFLLLLSFFIVSEWVPYTKLLVHRIYTESKTINPLVLLRKNDLPFTKNLYTEMSLNNTGSSSNDVLVAYYLEDDKRIALFLADHLDYANKTLSGTNISLISNSPAKGGGFDHLAIDNQSFISSPESFFVSLLERRSKLSTMVVAPIYSLIKSSHPKAKPELFQRISYILYPFTFTLLGLSGAFFNRNRFLKRDLLFISLALIFYITSFFIIRNPNLSPFWIGSAALAPHLLIPFFSLLRQRFA